MNNFAIKLIIDEVYYVKYYCWAWLWWKILFYFILFFGSIYLCCIPNYTVFVYLLDVKKIINFSYNEDLESRCVYIHIKVDNFVYIYITYFRIRKLKFIFSYTHILCGFFKYSVYLWFEFILTLV